MAIAPRSRGRWRLDPRERSSGLRELASHADPVALLAPTEPRSQRIDAGRLAHPDHPRGHAAHDRVLGNVVGHHRVRADDAVVPTLTPRSTHAP